MQELRLVAVSEDGTYLVLATAGRGTRFTLPVDDRLRAAVRGHFSRLGQFEIEVESPLRPKEIQARIRSGETAEEIAESAGIPVERVRWFEGPVLQEREYMAQQAQRVAVRRPGESTLGPPLGETVEERLGRGGVDLEEAEWDSWKCEDSTWRVRLSFFDNGRPHAAEWSFDPRRRHVSPLDEIAARLTAVEWDEETLSDTVTPLVPRRPAMKVVQNDRLPNDRFPGDRDVSARGLPAEPEQPAAVGPLRPAEPPQYIVERGRMVDPRPAFREAPAEGAPLREASRPLSSDGPREAPRLREAAEPARPAEDARPRDDRPAREEEPQAEAPAGDAASGAESAAEEAGPADREETRSEAASDAAEVLEESRPAEDEAGDDPAAQGAEPAEESEASQAAAEDPRPVASEDARDDVPAETAQADGDAPQAEDAQVTREEPAEGEPADEEPAPQEAEAAPAHDEPDQAEDAPAPAARESEKPAESDGGEAAPEEKAARPDLTPPQPAQQPAPKQPVPQQQAPQHPARREPTRPPAKKKPARPSMPAAQDKPVTGSPAAETPAQRPARPRRKAKGKRASVPSWDEIMFGARRPE
ncbi:DUF3071 domain-containing protein [Actinomadura sp. LD22]|uniref:DUF3071 domain-containing protein n=1 Tax=Actinomadura physcomitrii TaxID=2650748 RepID=A0A6I4M2Q9_9ACTN|nr:septation protein SepH [Actinomadura physcomitrii]MWA00033.1 DUF3071 domain-containing protein [Actinomadura physcomitrii]